MNQQNLEQTQEQESEIQPSLTPDQEVEQPLQKNLEEINLVKDLEIENRSLLKRIFDAVTKKEKKEEQEELKMNEPEMIEPVKEESNNNNNNNTTDLNIELLEVKKQLLEQSEKMALLLEDVNSRKQEAENLKEQLRLTKETETRNLMEKLVNENVSEDAVSLVNDLLKSKLNSDLTQVKDVDILEVINQFVQLAPNKSKNLKKEKANTTETKPLNEKKVDNQNINNVQTNSSNEAEELLIKFFNKEINKEQLDYLMLNSISNQR